MNPLRSALVALLALVSLHPLIAADARPNILCFIVDDMSANFFC
jgi:hypothetical protein